MKQLLLFIVPFLFAGVFACGQKKQSAKTSLAAYFKAIHPPDTLLFEVLTEGEGGQTAVPGEPIPTSYFFSQLETRLMNELWYFDNSEELSLSGKYRFPLTEHIEAYLVDIGQHWYRHLSLFFFDKTQKKFTGRVTVAEFYGGDGGQILGGSWLLDYDGDGTKDLVHREIEHWIDVSGEEPVDNTKESAALLLWKNGQFVATPVQDSASLIKNFPLHSLW